MKKVLTIIALSLTLLLVFVLPIFAITFPSQNGVSTDKVWKITFSQAVDATTLNNIVLTNTDNNTIFSIQPIVDPSNSKVVLVNHSIPFDGSTNYRLSVNTGVKNTSGKILSDLATISFDTSFDILDIYSIKK